LDAARRIDLDPLVRTIDLDEMAKARDSRAQRATRLVFCQSRGEIAVTFHEFDQPELPLQLQKIDAAQWSNLLKAASAGVREVAAAPFWNTVDDPLAPAASDALRDLMRGARDQLVAAGSSLYTRLVEDKTLKYVFNRIEGLAPGSRLTVESNCGFLPLEILYPKTYHPSFGTTPTASLLWGYRFRIEYLLFEDDASHKYPAAREQAGAPFVSLNLAAYIDKDLSRDTMRRPPFLPVRKHVEWFKQGLGADAEINQEFDIIVKTLREPHPATLLYYYCHGRADAPFGADPIAKLAFGPDSYVDPGWINTEEKFPHAPIVVLNSCSSGEAGPLSFTTFLAQFRRKAAAGVVSTWFAVPMLFASAFGRELVARYLRNEPIGDALFDLRRTLLERDNPLGLLYALQCPMDMKAPAPASRQAA
jgi:hypothetical protein